MVKCWPITCRRRLFRWILMRYPAPWNSLYKQGCLETAFTNKGSGDEEPQLPPKGAVQPTFPLHPFTILDATAFMLHQARQSLPLFTGAPTKAFGTHASPLYTGGLRWSISVFTGGDYEILQIHFQTSKYFENIQSCRITPHQFKVGVEYGIISFNTLNFRIFIPP